VAGQWLRRVTHAQGAGESGLGKLIELHAISSFGDALVAVSLAGTLFFTVPVGEARGRVAVYLLITMAPFALVAPVIGPLLDRFPHGRRWAIGVTLGGRSFLAWVMAGSVGGAAALSVYPAAFGVLVATKGYGVARATATPRLRPETISLVRANSRISLAGILAAGLAVPAGAAVSWLAGPGWSLRVAFGVFAIGAVLAARLPDTVDAERPASAPRASHPWRWPRRDKQPVSSAVTSGLRGNAALRAFAGFLIFYLAFELREHPLPDVSRGLGFGLILAAAGLGSIVGTSLGALLRSRAPEVITGAVLALASVSSGLSGALFGWVTVAITAGFTGFCQSLGKLSLDAVIQRDVTEATRPSAFARSETTLQLAWAGGGALGLVNPLPAQASFAILAVALLTTLGWNIRSR
jgi:MFS family permease